MPMRLLPGFFAALSLTACGFAPPPPGLPHLDLEMEGAEYRGVLLRRGLEVELDPIAAATAIDRLIAIGTRNLEWLAHINADLPPEQRIRFTRFDEARGIPIESPRIYGPSTFVTDLAALEGEMPPAMAAVLLRGAAFTRRPPIEVEAYRLFGRRIDTHYQLAARWRLLEPYHDLLAERRRLDVRGYYFLAREPDLDAKLAGWNELDPGLRLKLRGWLLGLCLNSGTSKENCERQSEAFARGEAPRFFARYRADGARVYDAYFRIPAAARRRDLRWTATESRLSLDRDLTGALRDFVVAQIEGEYRWQGWGLRLDFGGRRPSSPYVDLVPGVTPHVESLGGNRIVMDANQDLDEPEAQWIFRHEFGHVLGLPDCYAEFFETERNLMVNYQIDLNDLMCSRKGKMNERIFLELRRAYTLAEEEEKETPWDD